MFHEGEEWSKNQDFLDQLHDRRRGGKVFGAIGLELDDPSTGDYRRSLRGETPGSDPRQRSAGMGWTLSDAHYLSRIDAALLQPRRRSTPTLRPCSSECPHFRGGTSQSEAMGVAARVKPRPSSTQGVPPDARH